jgi:hypothetical protein
VDTAQFYALFSATCFALVGLWWGVVSSHPHWLGDPVRRTAVGGVYLSFLLPAAMGLFAQVGGDDTTTIWRASFVVFAAVGLVGTLRALAVTHRRGAADSGLRTAAAVLYGCVALIGLVPELGRVADRRPIEVEAMLLISLVLVAHGLVWRFMVAEHADDSRRLRESEPP